MRRPGWPTVFFNPGWIGLSHPYVPYKAVDEPAVAVAENHSQLGWARGHVWPNCIICGQSADPIGAGAAMSNSIVRRTVWTTAGVWAVLIFAVII